MNDLQRLLIERECTRLVSKYCHLVDHGEASRVADLFAPDGVWSTAEGDAAGREQVRATFQRRQERVDRRSRHVCGTLLIDVQNAAEATGLVYFTLYRHDGGQEGAPAPLAGPVLVGEYKDSFVCKDDQWQFARRRMDIEFLAERKRRP